MVDRVRVGNVEVLALLDCAPPPRDPANFFPDIPASAWDPYRKECLDADGKFRTSFCVFLLRSSGRTILVDTGLGPGPHPRFGGIEGKLLAQLKAHGVRPEDVNTVVITHLHLDHVGWNVSQRAGKPVATFPRARYLLPRGDWDHFTRADVLDTLPAVKANTLPLADLKVLDLVEGDHPVTPEVSTLATPGHTPGHLSILISSGDKKAIVVGDVFHNKVQTAETDWCIVADMDKDLARKTRHVLMDQAEKEGLILAVCHLPMGENIGHLVRVQGRRYWRGL